jgi:hypothetical protein
MGRRAVVRLRIWFVSVTVLISSCVPAWPALKDRLRLASSPTSLEPGQQVSVCAANVAGGSIELNLQLVNVRTGAVVANKSLKLAGLGSSPGAQDPCLTATHENIATQGPAGPTLVVAIATVTHAGFFRQPAITASLQVLAPGSDDRLRTVQSVSMHQPNHRPGAEVVYVPTQ